MDQAFFHFTAQSSSTSMGEFVQQIGGLVALICVLSLLWMGLMTVIIRRERERRRLKAEGLEPKANWRFGIPRWLGGGSGQTSPARSAGSAPLAIPTPDFDMLTGDFADADGADGEGGVWRAEGDPAPDAAPEAPEDPPMRRPAPYNPTPADTAELLRLLRDPADGTLVIEIGGRRFRTLADLRAAGLERPLRALLYNLEALPETATPAAPKPEPVPEPMAATRVPPAPTPEPVAAAPVAPAPPPALPRRRAPEPSPITSDDAISMRPGRMFRDMRRAAMGHPPEPTEAASSASIPDQIEALLQLRLLDTPAFAARSIHVTPSPEGGVRIEVDGVYYAGVGEVADDDVRALLADVVREWEESQ